MKAKMAEAKAKQQEKLAQVAGPAPCRPCSTARPAKTCLNPDCGIG
jgi:hypothetical protein